MSTRKELLNEVATQSLVIALLKDECRELKKRIAKARRIINEDQDFYTEQEWRVLKVVLDALSAPSKKKRR